MRIAVIGAGAMGSLAAMLFCATGEEVVVYEQRAQRADDVRETGVRVRGDIEGAAFPATGTAGEPADPYDVIVLAVSAAESDRALRPISPFVHRDTIYLSLQDGAAVHGLARIVGEERAFGALARVSARVAENGDIEVEGFRSLVLGAYAPGRKAALARLAEGLEEAFPGRTAVTQDLEGEIYRRMEAAAAVSGLCAVSGMSPGEARESEDIGLLCDEAARECRRVAVSTVHEGSSPVSPWEDAVWERIKPPMLRDIEAGRKTEIDFFSGHIVERARAAGIAVPVHSAVLTLVREIESGRHSPGEVALRELRRRVAEEKGMLLL